MGKTGPLSVPSVLPIGNQIALSSLHPLKDICSLLGEIGWNGMRLVALDSVDVNSFLFHILTRMVFV
jgi:hypothetical protein